MLVQDQQNKKIKKHMKLSEKHKFKKNHNKLDKNKNFNLTKVTIEEVKHKLEIKINLVEHLEITYFSLLL